MLIIHFKQFKGKKNSIMSKTSFKIKAAPDPTGAWWGSILTALLRESPGFSLLNLLFIFNGKIIALQGCVTFCCAAAWISCVYMCVPSLLRLLPLPCHATTGRQAELRALYGLFPPASSRWQRTHVNAALSMCPPSLSPPVCTSLSSRSASPFLPCTQVHPHCVSRFHVHMLLLLQLSHFSRVRLCVTPQTTAHRAPPSLGFSRQEQWSGLPFPSPSISIYICINIWYLFFFFWLTSPGLSLPLNIISWNSEHNLGHVFGFWIQKAHLTLGLNLIHFPLK